MLFRFIETAEAPARRNTLVWTGLALGLCLASKLYVPAVTFLLVTGFLVYDLWEPPGRPSRHSSGLDPQLYQRVGGAVLLTGAVSAAVYIAVFLPHFILGWWGGIADLIHYFPDVAGYERSVASATHPYSSPWWSWPLMLRPIAYWQNFPPAGKVATIWGGANPATIWGGFTAIAIIAAQALERRSLWRPFILIGYLGYLAIWVPIGRTLFLYHYMASEYLAYFALAAVLAQCWSEGGQPWEHVALILTLAPVFVLGLGSAWGIPLFIALAAGYGATLVQRPQLAGKFTCAAFSAVVLVLFIYYLPIWIGLPIERAGYYARMWLQGPGLRSWI
jgi:dolichyl-phosphate-mannose--protein O-mannosyl transferase